MKRQNERLEITTCGKNTTINLNIFRTPNGQNFSTDCWRKKKGINQLWNQIVVWVKVLGQNIQFWSFLSRAWVFWVVEGRNCFLPNPVWKQRERKIATIITINKRNVNTSEWVNGAHHSGHYALISHLRPHHVHTYFIFAKDTTEFADPCPWRNFLACGEISDGTLKFLEKLWPI